MRRSPLARLRLAESKAWWVVGRPEKVYSWDMSDGCAAMYVRVSTGGQSLETQNDAVVRAASARGERIGRVYAETEGGAARRRPELDRLLSDVRAGHVARLYVYRLDRLSRAGIRATLSIVEELQQHGVELVSIADGFTVAGPAQDVVLAVLAWAAQMERQAISERISAARTRVLAEGKAWGRPRREVDKSQVQAMRSEGLSFRDIAQRLRVPKSTLHRVLGLRGESSTAVPKTPAKTGPSELRKTRAKKG